MDDAARNVLVPEARELLAEMEATLLDLEVGGASADRINAVFRAAHTIKGSAGLFGLELVVSFTQIVESVLEHVRSGRLAIDATLTSLLLACGDYIGALVSAIEARREDVDPDPSQRALLLAQLASVLDPLAGGAAALARAANPQGRASEGALPGRCWHLSIRSRPDALRAGRDPFELLRHLRTMGTLMYVHTVTEQLPDEKQLDPTCCYLGFEAGLMTNAEEAQIRSAIGFLCEDAEYRLLPPESKVSDYIQILQSQRGSGERLGAMLVTSGALTQAELEKALALQVATNQEVDTHVRLGEILVHEQIVPAPIVAAALRKQTQADVRRGPEARLVKVDAAKLDDLITLVGELVVASEGARVLATRTRKADLMEALGKASVLLHSVRERALNMRMTPIGDVFQRFPRVVRDTSRELGKEIELVITGAETELDKSMVDKLSDPLLHIVRNAMDHGIESTAQRAAAGKSLQGRLHLHAYHESGCVVIEVRDDGRGLDRDRILAKALERGLVTPDQTLSDAEIYQLIFHAGFSTAAAVTSLSGRGVGMDVVKSNIEQLRGEVDIESRPGQGCTFRLRLPLTLAIVDGFQVMVGETAFVLPLDLIIECIDSSLPPGARGIASVREASLSYLRLRDLFRISSPRPRRESLVIVRHGSQRLGIVVDRLVGELQAVIKPLGDIFKEMKAVSSSTILGDGTVGLILDVAGLLTLASETSSAADQRISSPILSGVSP